LNQKNRKRKTQINAPPLPASTKRDGRRVYSFQSLEHSLCGAGIPGSFSWLSLSHAAYPEITQPPPLAYLHPKGMLFRIAVGRLILGRQMFGKAPAIMDICHFDSFLSVARGGSLGTGASSAADASEDMQSMDEINRNVARLFFLLDQMPEMSQRNCVLPLKSSIVPCRLN